MTAARLGRPAPKIWWLIHYLGLIVALICPGLPAIRAASTINPIDRFAFGANVGWLDARPDSDHGASIGEFICSGFLYSANLGWINLGSGVPINGVDYQNDSPADFGVNLDPLGQLTGCAWGANIGWVIFTNRTATGATFDSPKLDLFTGRLSGFAYAPNIGWITLSNLFAHVKTDSLVSGADSDHDGIADAWELSWVGNLARMSDTSNSDDDAANDREEYLADTDPLAAGDELRITDLSPSTDSTRTIISWRSRPTRVYRVQQQLDLGLSSPWIESESIPPDPGATTTRTLEHAGASRRYLRIRADLPLPRIALGRVSAD